MEDDKLYITRLMYAECSLGSMKNKLNLPLDHGVIYGDQDHPVMNANDHVPDEHIVHFGRCTSDKNVGNKISLESVVMNTLIPGSSLIKKMIGCDGCKCKPKTLTPWINTHKKHTIDGAPALLLQSTAVCFYGGIITILKEEPAEKTDQNDVGEIEQKKGVMDYLPASMQGKINDFCGQPNVDASPDGQAAVAANAAAIGAAAGAASGQAAQGGAAAGGGMTASQGQGGSSSYPAANAAAGGFVPGDFQTPYGASFGDWTDFGIPYGIAGIPGLNFSPQMSLQNLMHNRAQMLPFDALDAFGNIMNIGKLDCFNIGNTVLSAVDPGCSAVFNAINRLGEMPDLADIIFNFEQYAMSNFLPIGGPLISSAASMADYLTKQDFKVDTMIRSGREMGEILAGGLVMPQMAAGAKTFMPNQVPSLNGIMGTIPPAGTKPAFQAFDSAPFAAGKAAKGREQFSSAMPQMLMTFQKK